jgi:hypothetical protein
VIHGVRYQDAMSYSSTARRLLNLAATSLPHAVAPVICMRGYRSLSTILTRDELMILFPDLHNYINPSCPNVANVPEIGLSYIGIEQALRWREADVISGNTIDSTVGEMVHIYQALSYLGNRITTNRNLWLLKNTIFTEIRLGLGLEDYGEIWAMRRLPFVKPFVEEILVNMAYMYRMTDNHGSLDDDSEIVSIMIDWILMEEQLKKEVDRVWEKLRADKISVGRFGGTSAVQHFHPTLDPIEE